MNRIAIADDHAVVRKGLRQIIDEAEGLTFVGEAASADEVLTLLRSRPADVLVLDLTLGNRSGIDLLKVVKSEFPRLPVVILSMHPRRRDVRGSGNRQTIAAAIRDGGSQVLPHERLSDREFDVFRLLGSGMSVTEIAHTLNRSVKTVSTHRTRILAMTGLHSNAEMVDYVISHRLR